MNRLGPFAYRIGVLLVGLCASVARSEPIRVGFLLDSMQEERYQTDKSVFVDRIRALGGEAFFQSAWGSATKQEHAANDLLNKGISVLVIQPVDALRAVAIVKAARAKDVAVIAYDRMIESEGVDLYVTHNHLQAGRLQAQAASKKSKGPHTVICMGRQEGRVADDITHGNLEIAKQAGLSVVLRDYHPGWSADECKASVLKALHAGPVHVILANNSSMAVGAQSAFEGHQDRGEPFIAGADLTLESCRLLRAGKIHYDVVKPIVPLAETAAEKAIELSRRRRSRPKQTTAPIIQIDVQGVDKENLDSVLSGPMGRGFEHIKKRCKAS